MDRTPHAYTPHDVARRETSEQLRARIPGWGADLDRADRPQFPELSLREDLTGARWEFPERQPGGESRERSIEHAFVTPVFGTAQPRRGLSGAIRKHAYAKYSEARAAHWLMLIAADRVEATGAHLMSIVRLHPDNPITETGITSELTRSGLSSRFGRKRSDTNHQWMDPVLVAGPFVAAAVVGAKALARARRTD
ncbi:MAG: hypothetical protein JWN77_837 [Frankiales bacterium]|jgi:hypothetical protein|nr:hypothetical protein [Frankiales bacterium]